jgi:hypothetical protein
MRAGLVIAIVVAVLVILALILVVMVPRARGTPVAGNIVVRCSRGHLFTTLWVPGVSFKAVRLGAARFERCPVGHHWALVTPVREDDLTPEELAQARGARDLKIP